jgi:hypothetical protein
MVELEYLVGYLRLGSAADEHVDFFLDLVSVPG